MAALANMIREKLSDLDTELAALKKERAAFAAYKRAEQDRLQQEAEALAAWKRDEQRANDHAHDLGAVGRSRDLGAVHLYPRKATLRIAPLRWPERGVRDI